MAITIQWILLPFPSALHEVEGGIFLMVSLSAQWPAFSKWETTSTITSVVFRINKKMNQIDPPISYWNLQPCYEENTLKEMLIFLCVYPCLWAKLHPGAGNFKRLSLFLDLTGIILWWILFIMNGSTAILRNCIIHLVYAFVYDKI